MLILKITWPPPWRFCPFCPFVALILSKPIDQYVSKWLYVKSLFHLWPLRTQKAVFDSTQKSSLFNLFIPSIDDRFSFHEACVKEQLYFNRTFETLKHALLAWNNCVKAVSACGVCFWGKISLVHPRMLKQFCNLPSPFSNLKSPQGWICYVCCLSSLKDKWQKNAAVDKWGVTSPPASKYLLSHIINLCNWFVSPPKKKINLHHSLTFCQIGRASESVFCLKSETVLRLSLGNCQK